MATSKVETSKNAKHTSRGFARRTYQTFSAMTADIQQPSLRFFSFSPVPWTLVL